MFGLSFRIIDHEEIVYRGKIRVHARVKNLFPFTRRITIAVLLFPILDFAKNMKVCGEWRVDPPAIKPFSSNDFYFDIRFPDLKYSHNPDPVKNMREDKNLESGKYMGFLYLYSWIKLDYIVADRMFKFYNFNRWLKKRERLELDISNKSTYYFLYSKPFAKNSASFSSVWGIDESNQHLNIFCQDAFNLVIIVSRLGMKPDSVILDIGAGSCWTSEWLSRLGYRVIGYDISLDTLNIGNRRLENMINSPLAGTDYSDMQEIKPDFMTVCGDSEILPFRDSSIDYILCTETLHHVPKYLKVIEEASRVLKKDGKMLILEPGDHHSESAEALITMNLHEVLENSLDKKKITEKAKACGLKVKDYMVPLNTYEIPQNDHIFYRSYVYRLYGNISYLISKMLKIKDYMRTVIFLILEK